MLRLGGCRRGGLGSRASSLVVTWWCFSAARGAALERLRFWLVVCVEGLQSSVLCSGLLVLPLLFSSAVSSSSASEVRARVGSRVSDLCLLPGVWSPVVGARPAYPGNGGQGVPLRRACRRLLGVRCRVLGGAGASARGAGAAGAWKLCGAHVGLDADGASPQSVPVVARPWWSAWPPWAAGCRPYRKVFLPSGLGGRAAGGGDSGGGRGSDARVCVLLAIGVQRGCGCGWAAAGLLSFHRVSAGPGSGSGCRGNALRLEVRRLKLGFEQDE